MNNLNTTRIAGRARSPPGADGPSAQPALGFELSTKALNNQTREAFCVHCLAIELRRRIAWHPSTRKE